MTQTPTPPWRIPRHREAFVAGFGTCALLHFALNGQWLWIAGAIALGALLACVELWLRRRERKSPMDVAARVARSSGNDG